MSNMRRFFVYMSEESAHALEELARRCSADHNGGHRADGALTVEMLLQVLADDAALVVSTPGAMEAKNMQQVLRGHGYHCDAIA